MFPPARAGKHGRLPEATLGHDRVTLSKSLETKALRVSTLLLGTCKRAPENCPLVACSEAGFRLTSLIGKKAAFCRLVQLYPQRVSPHGWFSIEYISDRLYRYKRYCI